MHTMDVTMVAKTQPLPQAGHGFLSRTDFIGKIASICYGEKSTNYGGIAKSCIKRGHDSVVEHVYYTFRVDNLSRAAATQVLRHRMASYTMISQRYVSMEDADVIMPTSMVGNAVAQEAMGRSLADYRKLIAMGVKPEDARYVLPQAVVCSFYMTMNVRSLRNFLRLRIDAHAQAEIRGLAEKMYVMLMADAPALFEDVGRDDIEIQEPDVAWVEDYALQTMRDKYIGAKLTHEAVDEIKGNGFEYMWAWRGVEEARVRTIVAIDIPKPYGSE